MSDHVIAVLRTESGLSKHAFAEAVGTSRAAIDAYEKGSRSPTLATLERIAGCLERRLEISIEELAVSRRARAEECPDDLATFVLGLDVADEKWAWRTLTGDFLANLFAPATSSRRDALIARAPASTGSARWDAFVAALAEFGAVRGDVRVPDWVHESNRMSSPPIWWPVHGVLPSTRASAMAHTPAPFRRRLIHVDGRDLARVDP